MAKTPAKNKVLCIAGPTASGKSDWAVRLAKSVDGEIINADSMQVYKELRILSARPSDDEMEDVPHHMFGFVSGNMRYSVGNWTRDVLPIIEDCLARGKTPILVGGTGLYFKALTAGLAQVPEVDAGGMQKTESFLKQGIECLRAEAERLDPVAASRVLGHDPQRLTRIVSVALGTDRILSEWQKETHPLLEAGSWQGTLLLPDRQWLYDRINARYENMLNNGGMEEARYVHELGYSPILPMMKAIGLPPLIKFIDGEISYETAVSEAKRDTRRFAKRQFTWFRGQIEGWICQNSAQMERGLV